MLQACMAAALMEFLGGVLVGARVSGTIKNGIVVRMKCFSIYISIATEIITRRLLIHSKTMLGFSYSVSRYVPCRF